MPTRTLPTRDVTLADGRRLYDQHDESRHHAETGTQASIYRTKRGPDGALHLLITVDDEPAHGAHDHRTTSRTAIPRGQHAGAGQVLTS